MMGDLAFCWLARREFPVWWLSGSLAHIIQVKVGRRRSYPIGLELVRLLSPILYYFLIFDVSFSLV